MSFNFNNFSSHEDLDDKIPGRLWNPESDLIDCDGIGTCLGELIPNEEDGSGGLQTDSGKGGLCLRVAFAPDESVFAWISASRKVVLVPWNRGRNTFVEKKSGSDLPESSSSPNPKRIIIDCSYPVLTVAFGQCRVCQSNGIAGIAKEESQTKDIVLATGHTNGRIRIWNLQGKHLIELIDHRMEVRDLVFAPDGSPRLVSASVDGTLKCWDLEVCNMFKTFRVAGMLCVSWSSNSKLVACCGRQNLVYLWDMEKYDLYGKLTGHKNDVLSLCFSPDSSLLATASKDTEAILWDPYTLQKIYVLRHLFPPPKLIFASGYNNAWVRGISFANDGMHVVTIADDSLIRFWNLLGEDDPKGIATNSEEDDLCVSYSSTGRAVAIGTRKHRVSFYSVPQSSPTLKHLVRMAIRKKVTTPGLDRLDLPQALKNYLMFRVWN